MTRLWQFCGGQIKQKCLERKSRLCYIAHLRNFQHISHFYSIIFFYHRYLAYISSILKLNWHWHLQAVNGVRLEHGVVEERVCGDFGHAPVVDRGAHGVDRVVDVSSGGCTGILTRGHGGWRRCRPRVRAAIDQAHERAHVLFHRLVWKLWQGQVVAGDHRGGLGHVTVHVRVEHGFGGKRGLTQVTAEGGV